MISMQPSCVSREDGVQEGTLNCKVCVLFFPHSRIHLGLDIGELAFSDFNLSVVNGSDFVVPPPSSIVPKWLLQDPASC